MTTGKETEEERWKKLFSRKVPEIQTIFNAIDNHQTEYIARTFGLCMETEEDLAIVRSVRATYEGFLLLGWQLVDRGKIPNGGDWAREQTLLFLTIVAKKGMKVFKPNIRRLISHERKMIKEKGD